MPGSGRASRKEAAMLRTADDVAEVMGNMKGVAMKLGQILSLMGGSVPDGFADRLSTLQSQAPPMSIALVRQVFREEFNRAPEDLFRTFESRPFAAASIGQVHRATLRDGAEVAVKVQYPGVGDAIRHDLANLGTIFGLVGLAAPGLDPGPLVSDLRDGIMRELDYTAELRSQQRFGVIYDGHPFIRIPGVYPELSSGRILVQDFIAGKPFAAARDLAQEARDHVAEIIFRFTFGSMHRHGLFQADPHAGNYLLLDDGTVAFLDFGCVAEFSGDLRTKLNRMIAGVVTGDIETWRRGMVEVGYVPSDLAVSDDDLWEHMRLYYEFILEDGVAFTPEMAAAMVRQNVQLTGDAGKLNRRLNIPEGVVFTQRINFGFAGLMASIHARGPWHSIIREYVLDAPPCSALGRSSAEHNPTAWV